MQKQSWFGRLVERVFGALQRFYRRRLDGTIKQRAVFAWIAVLTIALSAVLYNAINRELAPAEDQGVLFAFVNAPEHTNLDYLTTYTDALTEEHDEDAGEAEHVRHQRVSERPFRLHGSDPEAVGRA